LSGKLARRASFLVEDKFRQLVVPLYFRVDIPVEHQLHQRAKPLPYLTVASQLIKEFGFKTIVEVGSMRQPLRHPLGGFDPMCCNDGHSTLAFAATGAETFTVDINPACAEVLRPYLPSFPNLHVATGDGLAFLERFDRAIDVLYLDAWDVVPGADYAENHLEAYRLARPRLSPACLVQIDDTDILNGGKGKLVIPQMIRDGFELITWGRQAMLVRDAG
jgi:hypothetical protein